jgi:hypothetical protein
MSSGPLAVLLALAIVAGAGDFFMIEDGQRLLGWRNEKILKESEDWGVLLRLLHLLLFLLREPKLRVGQVTQPTVSED